MIVTCNKNTRSITVPVSLIPIANNYFVSIDENGVIVLTTTFRADTIPISNTHGIKIRLPARLTDTFDSQYDLTCSANSKEILRLVPVNRQVVNVPSLDSFYKNEAIKYEPTRTDCVFCGLNDPFLDMLKLDGINVCYNCIDKLTKLKNEAQRKEQIELLEKVKGELKNE